MEDVQGKEEVDFSKSIRMFHLHTHFDDKSEKIAIMLYQALNTFIKTDLQYESPNSRVVYQKNGPHDKFNWEVYFFSKSYKELACSILFILANTSKELYHPFHCRTFDGRNKKNEFDDHSIRLGWIGKADEYPLDIDFFRRERW
eukprot:TRINITY_DN15224_c0_g1_i1.p1 TRINITY_DN15224_c0_g1~~TRINITY_DN15224_c0_g1_i1.p1  ORF type:complete len:155 (+),score=31.80 TRINITY_DN15224_c0_g1_i1:36-467(+)